MKKLTKTRILAILLLSMLSITLIPEIPRTDSDIEEKQFDMTELMDFSDDQPLISALDEDTPTFPDDYDIGKILGDRDNLYTEVYEPWKSKAAIHASAYDEETGYLALAGGYLYDNEIHIYRLNVETGDFDKVWDSGDGIIQSDVLSIAFGDTDLNNFIEIVAGSADGHVYVFEQRHIYDPYTNTENMFDHVWTSPAMTRVFDVKIEDVDRDYRPDIIAGTWEGLFLFEYDDHSGYPFADDHWISYRQVWTSGDLDGERIYTVEAGDTNANGLPEIICGTREGTVYVFENDGLSIMINGYPFPLINDNNYYLNWTSENYTWTAIRSMELGELDGTIGDEIAIIAQGQGLFTFDLNNLTYTYDYKKVVRAYESWETFGYWGLDRWVDRVISANNVTYQDPINATLLVSEPIEYVWNVPLSQFLPNAHIYPYNTGMAMATDGNYTTFDASLGDIPNATAIVDFGLDEEGTGSANADPDVIVTFKNPLTSDILSKFNFSISQDGTSFEQISSIHFSYTSNLLKIDIDDALSRKKWDWFRYAQLSVFDGATYEINSLELQQVYNLLTDALSVTIGPLRMDGDAFIAGESELDKIIVGTVTGKYIGISWDNLEEKYEIVWDSGNDEFYSMGTGIWDLQHIQSTSKVPIWRNLKEENVYFPNYFSMVSTSDYNSWSFGKLDPWGLFDASPSYFVGTKSSQIVAHNMLGVGDTTVNGYLSDINLFLAGGNKPYTSVETFELIPGYPMPLLAVASYNPDQLPTGNLVDGATAELNFFFRDDLNLPFASVNRYSMSEFDKTGEITSLIAVSKTTPKLDFTDIDGDGDNDMIFSNGQLYLAKNLFKEINEINFTIVHDYFSQINAELTSYGWGQPELCDLDRDGDLDVILSYATKNGTTAFINEGTAENPDWVQEKRIFSNTRPETNMKFMNLTDTRIIPRHEGYSIDTWESEYDLDEEADYMLVSYNNFAQRTSWATPVYDAVDSYIVATYPTVARMEFSLLDSGDDDFRNYGFHIYESWSNEDDLEGWTLSITSGDIDNDGNGEIIIGDYDNNVYVFENMVNNTYKRMYKTFDIIHNETTDESPYLYEELEGISGTFTRNIWDHVKHVVAGVDLDNNGLNELIVAANLQVYIFEDKNLTGGDELEFVYSIDLRDSGFIDEPGWDQVDEITAMCVGNDLDYNGENELILAAGPYLFVYNVPEHNFIDMENNEYFVTSSDLEGRYNLLGNPYADESYEYAWISTLTTGDTDQDGYREIILGGTLDTRAIREDGFVHIYECQGGTFYQAWEAPSQLTKWNPVNVLTIDDQDYDGAEEIIIGHNKGFDIWEWIAGSDSNYQKVEHVTSSPNYPIIDIGQMNSSGDMWILARTNAPTDEIEKRSKSDLTHGKGAYSNYIYQIFSYYGRNFWKKFDKSTSIWNSPQYVLTDLTYGDGTFEFESEPAIATMENGDIYATWRYENALGYPAIWVSKFNLATEIWGTPYYASSSLISSSINYPDIFEYDNDNIGLICVYGSSSFKTIYNKTMPKILASSTYWSYLDFEGRTNYNIHSASITTLSDGSYAIAMSAINIAISKPDFDIWVLMLNNSFAFDEVSPYHATNSYNDELFPDIDYLRSEDESLVVIYENLGASFEDRIGMVASTTRGLTWKSQQTLNTIPNNLERKENLQLGYVEWELNPNAAQLFFSATHVNITPIAFAPTVIGLDSAGFMYNFVFTAPVFKHKPGDHEYLYGFPMYGINTQSDWTGNSLTEVVDLDVGDTDNDGRREVVAGWDHQVSIYELKSSVDEAGSQMMKYDESWLSETFENPFTGVTVYDSNGNGWEEIGIATERGDVYVIEYRATSEGLTPLTVSQERWDIDIDTKADPRCMFTYDIDDDSFDEIIICDGNTSKIVVIDDNGSIIWSDTFGTGYTRGMGLFDITNDSLPEILFAKENGYIYAINILTGVELWNFTLGAVGDIEAIDVGDISLNGTVEVVFANNVGNLTVLDYQGNFLYELDGTPPGVVTIYSISLGHFYDNESLSLAYSDSSGVLRIANITDGTILYESDEDIITNSRTDIIPYDFDGNGIEEIVFVYDRLRILDVNESAIIYNSTYYGTSVSPHIFIEDFDGDDQPEILVSTKDNGIYLENFTSGITLWHYSPDIGLTYDISIGNFGGSGAMDVAVVGRDGTMVAIDGKCGLPMWFNDTTFAFNAVAGAWLGGPNLDSIIAYSETGEIYVFDHSSLIVPPTEEMYTEHNLYLEFETGETNIVNLWVHDVSNDGNGIDEILTYDYNKDLILWNATTGTQIWKQNFSDDGVRDVRFGNLNNLDFLDLAVRTKNGDIYLLKGESGEISKVISAPSNFSPRDFYIGEFNQAEINDEIVVLYENKADDKSYLEWFNSTGDGMYTSNSEPKTGNYMAVGYYSGQSSLDVLYGGYNQIARIYYGGDGTLYDDFSVGYNIYGIISGNFKDDVYEDFALIDANSNITLVDGDTMTVIAIFGFDDGKVRDFQAADIWNDDSIDELIVNLIDEGVIGYESSGNEVWSYDAPLVLDKSECLMSFSDMGNDGTTDLIFTNYNYLNIINGSTEKLSWHYVGVESKTRMLVGRFTESGVLDVVFKSENRIIIVSGAEIPPNPPDSPDPPSSQGSAVSTLFDHWSSSNIPVYAYYIGSVIFLVIIPYSIIKSRKKKN